MDNTQELQKLGLNELVDIIVERSAQRTADIVCERLGVKLRPDEDLITRQEAEDILKVTETTLWRWERLGIIHRAGTFGRKVYYSMTELKQAMKEQSTN